MRLSIIKRNVFANLVGTGLVAILTVLITPLQINILGIEAFGVVGFIATLQVMFAAFDLGLSSTLVRELAADVSAHKVGSQGLLSTASAIYWGSAILIGTLIAGFAGPIARWWFNADKLSPDLLVDSLRVIALYLALRWPVSLYIGVLSGLQRMDVLNLVKVTAVVVRLAIGILVVLHWRSLEAFLIWTAISAVFETSAYLVACARLLTGLSLLPGFSLTTVKRVWQFSASMNVLSILGILMVQMDRLVLSKAQTLDVLGYYNLAYTMASGIAMVIGAINAAVFPWFTEAQKNGQDRSLLLRRYHDATFTMLMFVGLAASVLMFYGHEIIALWVNPHAADGAALPAALLAFGFWCSAAITNVYNVAIACGRPKWHLRVNLISVIPYVLTLFFLVGRFGANGAALAWILLNLAYALFLVVPIHRHLLGIGVGRWIAHTIVPPFVLGFSCFVPIRILADLLPGGAYTAATALIFSVTAYVMAGVYLLHKREILLLPVWGRLRSS
jgi:O-antigen/teichoic acid export membrane protein